MLCPVLSPLGAKASMLYPPTRRCTLGKPSMMVVASRFARSSSCPTMRRNAGEPCMSSRLGGSAPKRSWSPFARVASMASTLARISP